MIHHSVKAALCGFFLFAGFPFPTLPYLYFSTPYSSSTMNRILFGLFLLPFAIIAQSTDHCTPSELYSIKAESGMKMRQGPGTNYNVVVFVPSKNYLLVCKEKSTPAAFEGKPGHWRRVRYKGYYGYMFDGFLQKTSGDLYLNDTTWQVVELPNVQAIIDTVSEKPIPQNLDSIPQTPIVAEVQLVNADSLHRAWKGDTLYMDSIKVFVKDSVTVDTLPWTDPSTLLPPEPNYQFAVETFNYCGPIDHLDPGLKWYGIFHENNKYRIRDIELLIVRSKYSLGSGVEFDIRSEDGIPPHFMIGTNKRINTLWHVDFPEDYFLGHPDKLFPGQKVSIYSNDKQSDLYNFTLYATGNVTDVGNCPEMENYQLMVSGEMHDKLIEQNIYQDLDFEGQCGIPKLYWFGDLNQDKYPDFIFAGLSKDKTSFTLFLSDIRNHDVLVRKAGTWFYTKCE